MIWLTDGLPTRFLEGWRERQRQAEPRLAHVPVDQLLHQPVERVAPRPLLVDGRHDLSEHDPRRRYIPMSETIY
jgi:hypothetical protein